MSAPMKGPASWSRCGSLRTRLIDSRIPLKKASLPIPAGVTGPRPVILTRRRIGKVALSKWHQLTLGGDSSGQQAPRCKRDLPCSDGELTKAHTMTAQEFEAHIVSWASAQPGLEALVQIGSR